MNETEKSISNTAGKFRRMFILFWYIGYSFQKMAEFKYTLDFMLEVDAGFFFS